MAYKLFVKVGPGGAIESSILSPDLTSAPAGFVELPPGAWWSDVAGDCGSRWYYDDGPKKRRGVRLVIDKGAVKPGDTIRVSLQGESGTPISVSVGGVIERLVPGEDVVLLRSSEEKAVRIAVVDPRFLPSEAVVEFKADA